MGGLRKWTRTGVTRAAGVGAELVNIVVPVECGGCGARGVRWCAQCERAVHDVPLQVHPRVLPDAPVWALGRYAGPHRRAVVALKERDRRDLDRPLGRAVAHGLLRLHAWGELGARSDTRPLLVVPAPTSAAAARRRGGEVVTAVARHAVTVIDGRLSIEVVPALRTRAGGVDAVGLSAADRATRVIGQVVFMPRFDERRLRSARVVVLDDVVTTGATLAESVRMLRSVGAEVAAALAIAAA